MIQVYKKNELFIIENTVTDIIYPNLTREEALVLLKKFDRDEPEDRCDFAIKEDNVSFEYASIEEYEEMTNKIADLQSQLAEKEKEIESYKHFKITIGTMENNQVDISSTTYTDQDKISFALEQLEKVKETTECVLDNALKNSSLNQSYYDRLLDEIDNQINELKEMNNG